MYQAIVMSWLKYTAAELQFSLLNCSLLFVCNSVIFFCIDYSNLLTVGLFVFILRV